MLNGIDKGQIALKEVHPLHEIPLRFPNQIDLYSERKEVIPNKYHTDCNYGEDQKIQLLFQ